MAEPTPLRLVTFEADGFLRAGVYTERGVVDLHDATRGELPCDLRDLVEMGPAGVAMARAAAATGKPVSGADVRLAPPIPAPRRNVFAVGHNYAEHVAESARGRGLDPRNPEYVVFFTKPASSLIGPYDDIELDTAATGQLDYEVELVAVIGRRGRNIPAAEAPQFIFGYTVGNDVSARDLQSAHKQWF